MKNDGLSHPIYGGSKVRKAERLVAAARSRGARRVLSFGAAGSHHLLTLSLFARAAGLECAAILIPQPYSVHAEETLRAALGLGLQAHAAPHLAYVPALLARVRRRGDYLVPPGGSNVTGARACADAVDELRVQINDGLLPRPDIIVLPLGSGGTCGGIAAGVVRRALPCRVLGVQVVSGLAPRLAARWLARRVLGAGPGNEPALARLDRQLEFDAQHVGPGYGAASVSGTRALSVAQELGLELDQTYTAKAFAMVLALLESAARAEGTAHAPLSARAPLKILYWHTLSARPLAPLLECGNSAVGLPTSLRQLLR